MNSIIGFLVGLFGMWLVKCDWVRFLGILLIYAVGMYIGTQFGGIK